MLGQNREWHQAGTNKYAAVGICLHQCINNTHTLENVTITCEKSVIAFMWYNMCSDLTKWCQAASLFSLQLNFRERQFCMKNFSDDACIFDYFVLWKYGECGISNYYNMLIPYIYIFLSFYQHDFLEYSVFCILRRE